jgi:phosphomannomutase
MQRIRFGTDGWRGVIADDFTLENVSRAAQAIARYVIRCEDPHKGVFVGCDHRFASDHAAATIAEVLSAMSMPVWLADRSCLTPAISLLVRQRAAGGHRRHGEP